MRIQRDFERMHPGRGESKIARFETAAAGWLDGWMAPTSVSVFRNRMSVTLLSRSELFKREIIQEEEVARHTAQPCALHRVPCTVSPRGLKERVGGGGRWPFPPIISSGARSVPGLSLRPSGPQAAGVLAGSWSVCVSVTLLAGWCLVGGI